MKEGIKNPEMRVAFLGGLKDFGYIDSNVDINSTANSVGSVTWDNSKVVFTLGVPKSQQPKSKTDDFNNSVIRSYYVVGKIVNCAIAFTIKRIMWYNFHMS
ncbi:hypothetical protein [Inconstantimicrobium mannanitabidum]|uniref:Uncharacterized protein n=1 Tax=Inconstantimicrobium mannanitabidum TaxID=1604901 RepID=A0ACB5RIU0_9CLOT|nr:hypothetical protein [Clostridium sp. TW13]GKX69015.1 hypothetical protein rsdtw13_42730 [Clostridium sp. TW13]